MSVYSRAANYGWCSTVVREALQQHGRLSRALFVANVSVYKYYSQSTCNAALSGDGTTVASSTHSRLRQAVSDMTALMSVTPESRLVFSSVSTHIAQSARIVFKDHHNAIL